MIVRHRQVQRLAFESIEDPHITGLTRAPLLYAIVAVLVFHVHDDRTQDVSDLPQERLAHVVRSHLLDGDEDNDDQDALGELRSVLVAVESVVETLRGVASTVAGVICVVLQTVGVIHRAATEK